MKIVWIDIEDWIITEYNPKGMVFLGSKYNIPKDAKLAGL